MAIERRKKKEQKSRQKDLNYDAAFFFLLHAYSIYTYMMYNLACLNRHSLMSMKRKKEEEDEERNDFFFRKNNYVCVFDVSKAINLYFLHICIVHRTKKKLKYFFLKPVS